MFIFHEQLYWVIMHQWYFCSKNNYPASTIVSKHGNLNVYTMDPNTYEHIRFSSVGACREQTCVFPL